MIRFFDFDGVIADSIDECYVISKDVYFGYAKFPYNEEKYKALFYQYRGLVRPAYEYMILHESIEAHLKDNNNIVELFKKILVTTSNRDKFFYEKDFFYKRSLYQSDNMKNWLSMNPITPFGKTLVGRSGSDVIIVTTKNREATETLLNHYKIKVNKIYANDDIKFYGDKGALISHVMDEKNISEAIFLDDAVEHLETVNDKRVECYFADWGYGKNSYFKIYNWKSL